MKRSPNEPVTPLLRGRLAESENWTIPGDTLIRYATPSGATIVNAPTSLLSPKVRATLYDLFVALDTAAT